MAFRFRKGRFSRRRRGKFIGRGRRGSARRRSRSPRQQIGWRM